MSSGFAELDHRRHAQLVEQTHARLYAQLVDGCEERACAKSGWIHVPGWDEARDLPDDKLVPCPCLARVRLGRAMADAGIPERFWGVETLVPTYNEAAFDELHRYAEHLERAITHGLSLVLTGKNGSGKTSSACIPMIRALRNGHTAALISWPNYIDGQRRGWRDADLQRHLDERAARDLVFIDELGKEGDAADPTFAVGKLDQLLRNRNGSLLPVIIATNLTMPELATRYGASIESLLSEDRFRVIKYRTADFRKQGPVRDWDALLTGSE